MLNKPAKELAILLQSRVMLEVANSKEIAMINGNNDQFNIVANQKNQFLLNRGPAMSIDHWDFSLTQDQAFKALADAIQSHGDRIKFHLLRLPVTKSIEHCMLDINGNVLIRAIEYYEIRIDEILTRYDVLVEKVKQNA